MRPKLMVNTKAVARTELLDKGMLIIWGFRGGDSRGVASFLTLLAHWKTLHLHRGFTSSLNLSTLAPSYPGPTGGLRRKEGSSPTS